MRITFLGGAEEVGASCALVEIDGVRLLVDGGQRLGAPSGEALPDFSVLEDGPALDAVLVTHAHADHIGALPALEPHLSDQCPAYATAPTIALCKVMLQDSVRIMTHLRDGETPLFAPANVGPALSRLQAVRWLQPVRIGHRRDVTVTFRPSGHILGAAMLEIRGPSGCILFSGDLSVANQLTVPGVLAPKLRPDILVLESTYGGRLHAHRPTQERRLIERVRETIKSGGSALFPTFALGRAQEILLLLGRAMRDGSLPRVPVHADGMVRAISKIYRQFPDDLAPLPRGLHESGLDPIFPEDLPIRPVRNEGQREGIAKGPPCVVVSSSGMLQGGASAFYARSWLGDPKHLVMLTGYQDEESPGQALLNLAATPPGEPRVFRLGGVPTSVNCSVESCWLSAHADNDELVAFASKLRPKLILPVHGDGDARAAVARSLQGSLDARVVLPLNGSAYTLASAEIAVGPAPEGRASPTSFWPPWNPAEPRTLDLARFHEWLSNLENPIEWVTLDELAELWRAPAPITGGDWADLRRAVYAEPQAYFRPDTRRPYILHGAPKAAVGLVPTSMRLPVERALVGVREVFPASSGLRTVGFYPEEEAVRLGFDFPAAVQERCVAKLRALAEKIGWKVVLREETADADLVAAARAAVDDPKAVVTLAGGTVKVASAEPDETAAERFRHRTGFKLTQG